ncbi:MAG: class I SAM-dependent methyltransferase [Candidatus Hecatellaceae archaeon]
MRGKGLKGKLKSLLSEGEAAEFRSSLEIIGDLAVVRLPPRLEPLGGRLAEAIMQVHSNVKAVFSQASPVEGEFRLRRLRHLAGENRTETVHREHGYLFKTDIAQTYFSPRLQYERVRVARLVQPGETVVNMFAGVGCFSIVIARKAKPAKVYSVDLNPQAYRYMRENILLNRLVGVVKPILGDAKTVVEKLKGQADRVLMPLPAKAREYLPYALQALKPRGGWIHYYDFVQADDRREALTEAFRLIPESLEGFRLKAAFGRIVRSVGPRWYQTVLDVEAKPSEGF